jgi:hypothetical protein
MSNTVSKHENALFVARMSIERCRRDLAHLQALLYMNQISPSSFNEPDRPFSQSCVIAKGMADILVTLDKELADSEQILDYFE